MKSDRGPNDVMDVGVMKTRACIEGQTKWEVMLVVDTDGDPFGLNEWMSGNVQVRQEEACCQC